MSTAGICLCSNLAIASGLASPCQSENDFGICEGVRGCTEDGLSACDAPEAAAEVCNGVDDNCNGLVDENTCDDGNGCTTDVCAGEQGCEHTALTEGECLDGDACTVGDHCEAGVCVGLPVDCDDGNPCTVDTCDGLGGCTNTPTPAPCDDGDNCTVGDLCADGVCAGTATLDCNDSNPCTDDACGVEACTHTPNTQACDDGNACTDAAACKDGVCVGTNATECDDENGCTTDSCDPAKGCAYSNNISWTSEVTPNSKEVDPRRAFDRLFGNGKQREEAENKARRARRRLSILDFVLEDARRLVARRAVVEGAARNGAEGALLRGLLLDDHGVAQRAVGGLGRPPRESSCECERQNDVELSAVMTMLNSPAIASAIGDPDNAIAKLVASEPDDRTLIEKLYLRIFSRHPSEEEISLVVDYWSQVDKDHKALVAHLAEQETQWVDKKIVLENERLQAIEQAQTNIETYNIEHQAEKAAAQAKWQSQIDTAQQILDEFETNELPGKQDEWIRKLTIDRFWTTWQTQQPSEATATKGIELAISEDGSILASGGPIAYTDYTLTIPVKSTTISGVMLATLTHDSLKGFGPGLNENGNFVVSEFEVSYALEKSPDNVVKVKLVDARADFNQDNFDVKNAINDNRERNDNGWAVGGPNGRASLPHWARFQLSEPLIIGEEGATLTVTIVCQYSDGSYPLGRFRVSTTDSPNPLNLGLPAPVADILRQPPSLRSPENKSLVTGWFRDQQSDYLAKRFEWVRKKRPLPADPQLEQLKVALSRTERPVQDDPDLLQLRKDVEHSLEQSNNARLTAAQDLSWALINNAAFLFNH